MTDQKQAPERIWAEPGMPGYLDEPHELYTTEYICKDLHDAAIKQRDELAAAALALRNAQRAYMADRGNDKLGRAVASAAEVLDVILDEIRALPASPDGQQELNEMLADAWADGRYSPPSRTNPYRKDAT